MGETCEHCDVDEKLMACKTEIGQQVEALRADVECIKEIHSDVKELLDIFRTSKGFFKGVWFIGKGIRFAALTSAAFAALWTTVNAVFHSVVAWI